MILTIHGSLLVRAGCSQLEARWDCTRQSGTTFPLSLHCKNDKIKHLFRDKMMWVYLPEEITSSACAVESECLTLDTDLLAETLEQSAMWRSKPLPKRSWLRVLKTVSWMMPLYGQTLKHSIANRGVEQWIRLLEDSLANPSLTLVESKEQLIPDISGPTSPTSLKRYNPLSASLRMSMDSYQHSLPMDDMPTKLSNKTYETWVTKLRQDYSLRIRLAHPTDESGSLYWRTPNQQEPGINEERLEGDLGHRMYDKETGRLAQVGLTQQARIWRTPDANMGNRGQKSQDSYEDSLENGTHALNLNDQVEHLWSSPRVSSANGSSEKERLLGNPKQRLETQAAIWMTPSSLDWKDTGLTENVPTNSLLGRQVQRVPMNGGKSSKETRRLNPRFAEWLMGWIPNWTHPSMPIHKTDLERLETEWFHIRLRLLTRYFPEE